MQNYFSISTSEPSLPMLEATYGANEDKHVSMNGDFSSLLFSPEMNCCKMKSEAPSTINLTKNTYLLELLVFNGTSRAV